MTNKKILTLMFLLAFLTLLVGCFPSPTPPIIENQAPIITSKPVLTAKVGVVYTYDVNATDPEEDVLTYSLTTKPTNMTIKSTTGVINWLPNFAQVGDNAVTVRVSDGALSVIQSFTIKVSKPTPTPIKYYIITATAGDGGSIDPSGKVKVKKGLDKTFTITPDADYLIADVLVDGISKGAVSDYTFTSVTADHTIHAIFSAVVTLAAIPGVTAPATGATPVTTITETAQYTGTVTWAPEDDPFLGSEVYTATITLTAKAGFTLTDVAANFFTVAGADPVSNVADSGVVTAVFPKTDPAQLTSILVDPDKMTLFVGDFGAFKVTAHYNDGNTKNVTNDNDCVYSSSDDSVASIISNPFDIAQGRIEAFKVGTATIFISYTEGDIEKIDTLKVEVIDLVHNTDTDKYYHTIQAAINDELTSAGDTITVAAGIYEENVTIDESVTLQGEDRETTEIIFGYGLYPSLQPLVISADDVTVSGFTIRSGPYIEKDPFTTAVGGYAHTIIVNGDSALFTDLNVIKESLLYANDGSRIGGSAFWLGPGINGFTFTDSIVESEWNGIYAREDGSDIVVRNVEFTYPGDYGILLKTITGATIEENTFTCTGHGIVVSPPNEKVSDGIIVTRDSNGIEIRENQFIGSEPLVVSHIGILLQDFYGEGDGAMGDVTILNNEISNFNVGILVEDIATSEISIHKNNIYDNSSYGLNYLGLDTVNAENNWWGKTSGPTHSGNLGGTGDEVSDNVDYSPFSTEENW